MKKYRVSYSDGTQEIINENEDIPKDKVIILIEKL